MVRKLFRVAGQFFQRTQNDHLGAYAATCAYFVMISFVPFFMIIFALAGQMQADLPALTEHFIEIIPSGLKSYVISIITEVSGKSYSYMPASILVLLWSASKLFHALTNGLNVIGRVEETRGWFFLRLRSMFFVLLFLMAVGGLLTLNIFGQAIEEWLMLRDSLLRDVIWFFYKFRSLFGYFGLILFFLFVYTFLPNCRYTVRSQLPGALIVSTMWMFLSYLLSVYYEHNQNFYDVYGSITSVVLAMMWLYFCSYFLLVGAELNRVIYEDPDDNLFVNALDVVRDASAEKQRIIEKELAEGSKNADEELPIPVVAKGIRILWADEEDITEEKTDAKSGKRRRRILRFRKKHIKQKNGGSNEQQY